MDKFINLIKKRVLVYDGSKGYMLQKAGLRGGECPELWNKEHSSKVMDIHTAYVEAGCDVIQTNTFQGNRLQLEKYSLQDRTYELNYLGARLARDAMGNRGYVAASIGPTGKMFEPFGDLTFQKALDIFREQVKALVDGGVDIINFETFTDLAEMRAAYFAAREVSSLPVICSFSFESTGKTMMGSDPYTAALVMKSLGADMIGTNCSFGPDHMLKIVRKMHDVGDIFLSVKPNAGIPKITNGETEYSQTPQSFSSFIPYFIEYGARLVGGCCGTTPEYISDIKDKVNQKKLSETASFSGDNIISSSSQCVNVLTIEENSIAKLDAGTDDELLKRLNDKGAEYIAELAMHIQEEGTNAIYVNVDNVEKEKTFLANVVEELQTYVKCPLIFGTKDPEALESALVIYKGVAGVMADGSADIHRTAKKYGSVLLNRIPE